MKSAEKEYKNIPPKDIQNAIWGSCFDYKDFDEIVDGKTIRDRIYECWNRMHLILKNDDQGWFIDYVQNSETDLN